MFSLNIKFSKCVCEGVEVGGGSKILFIIEDETDLIVNIYLSRGIQILTLKALNKTCSRRHFNFLLLYFEGNKA